jgi:hypothetical protein
VVLSSPLLSSSPALSIQQGTSTQRWAFHQFQMGEKNNQLMKIPAAKNGSPKSDRQPVENCWVARLGFMRFS